MTFYQKEFADGVMQRNYVPDYALNRCGTCHVSVCSDSWPIDPALAAARAVLDAAAVENAAADP